MYPSWFSTFLSIFFTLRTFPVTVNFAGYLPSIFGPQTTLQLLKPFPNLPPKRAFWPVVKRTGIILFCTWCPNSFKYPLCYEAKRARGAYAQDRSHGMWHRPIRDQKRIMSLSLPCPWACQQWTDCKGTTPLSLHSSLSELRTVLGPETNMPRCWLRGS